MPKLENAFMFLLVLSVALVLCSCVADVPSNSVAENHVSENGQLAANTDNDEQPTPPQRVVVLSSSLAEMWLLAGGTLLGTSSDTLERGFTDVPTDIAVVGTVQGPSLEAILELKPDFILMSADLTEHVALEQALKSANIRYYYAKVKSFSEYLTVLEYLCGLTGNLAMFEQNGRAVQAQIDTLLKNYQPANPPPSYLLMRVHSSGGKVIANDHVACDILDVLGAVNIASKNQNLLSDLSLEAILESDPEHIFVLTMGDEAAAMQTLEQVFTVQPAWQQLEAVQKDNLHILPRELFHHKPNAKWGEAYAYLIDLLAS